MIETFTSPQKTHGHYAPWKAKILQYLFLTFGLIFFYSPGSQAQTCCPEFSLKDLQEICPPEGACPESGDSDGHGAQWAACAETTHTYTVYPNDPIYTYEWTVTGGTPSSSTGNPVNLDWGTGTTGFITVHITGTNGCEETLTREICLIEGPQAEFSFQPGPFCINTPVNFTNLSTGSGDFFWDFGDGNTSTDFNPVHSYDQPGTYEITLTVTDIGGTGQDEMPTACGCSDSYTLTIEIEDGVGPVIDSQCCDGTVCPGDTSVFTTSSQCSTYIWSVTGGTITGGQGTDEIIVQWDATYSVPTTVSLETPACGTSPCSGATTLDIPVLYPDLPISGPVNLCQGSNGTFTLPNLPGTYYNWSITGGNYNINTYDQNTNELGVTFISEGTYEITAGYDNPLTGCAGQSSITVEVKPVFTLSSADEDLLCEGSKGLYFANGDVSSWSVSPAGPNVDVIASDAGEVTWNTAGEYIITAEAASPGDFCNAEAMTRVEVVAPPQLDPIEGPTTVCPDTYLTYKASSDTEGSDFVWSIDPPASGSILSYMGSDKDSVVVVFNGSGPWTLEVYQEIEAGPSLACTSEVETLTAQAVAPPVISSQSGNSQVCVDAIEVYSTSLPLPQGGYEWSISPANRGTILSGQGTEEIEVRWHGTPANATVSVSSCSGTDQMTIDIIDPPFIDFITADGPTFYCLPDAPSNLTLSTSLDANFDYQWFLNGTPIAGATSHEYTIASHPPSIQTYIYEVEASNGICTITRGILVIVTDDCDGGPGVTCDLDFTFDPDPACVDQPVSFQAIPTPGGFDFEWDFGDNSTSFTQDTEKAYGTPGVYDVTLTGTYMNVCSLVVEKQVTVHELPVCEIAAADTIFCPGDSLLLEACTGMLSYQWYREGSPVNGADQETFYATEHGLYQVEATNQFGCSNLSEGIYIFSHSTPRAKISAEKSLCIVPNQYLNFNLSTPLDPDYIYEWSSNLPALSFSPNNGNNAFETIAFGTMPDPLPSQIEFYLSVTDIETGCVNYDTLCVSVYETPQVTVDWVMECEENSHTLTPSVIDTNQYHYQWSNGAVTPEITVSQAGFYSLIVTDKATGCSTSSLSAAFITPGPDLSLFPTGCETIMVDQNLDLYVPLPLNSTSWPNTYPDAYPNIEWYAGNNLLGNGQSFQFSSAVPGYFEVYATVENQYGCSDTTVVFCITVEAEEEANPQLSVSKVLNNINESDLTEYTQVGDVLTYDIEVCNTGNVPLYNIVVTDPLTGMSENIAQLDPGDCASFATSYTITQEDIDTGFVLNTVTTEGEDADGNAVTDEAEESVPGRILPGISVNKELAHINESDLTEFTQVGDVLTYNIEVCNTGNVILYNIVVTDPLTGMSETIAQLEPGDCVMFSTSYTVTQDDLDAGFVLNTVTSVVEDADGVIIVIDEDEESVTGSGNPDISVNKELVHINESDLTEFTQVGDVLTYTIEVCNTGNVTLYNIMVTDPLTGMSENIAQLEPGDCEVFTTSYTVTEEDMDMGFVRNTVSAEGEDGNGTPVSANDFEIVDANPETGEPGLLIEKNLVSINDNPEQNTYNQVGDLLMYEIIVTNTGNVTLTNVVVTDPLTGLSQTIPSLAPNDSQSFFTSYTVQPANLIDGRCYVMNTATAETSYQGNPVTSSDTLTVDCKDGSVSADDLYNEHNDDFVVYPNPTKGTIYLESSRMLKATSLRIEIVNMMGEIVVSKSLPEQKRIEIDLKDTPPGVYYLRVFEGEKVESQMIIRL